MGSTRIDCPVCGGHGATFVDAWEHGSGHYTEDSVCDVCEGTGEIEERCECGGPAEHRDGKSDTGWICVPCKADIDAELVGQPHAVAP
jgi:DnaJ-class molecular chaperone